MVLITKRRQIGAICGHTVYAVSKSEMIPLPYSSVRSNINDKNENRLQSCILYIIAQMGNPWSFICCQISSSWTT